MLKIRGPTSIIRLFYVMVIILVFCVFTTRDTRWQHQFVSTAFNCWKNIAFFRIQNYLLSGNTFNKFQSAYMRNRSTESALIKVHNDLSQAVNRKGGAELVMLDLSAAFDTLDHSIFLDPSRHVFGFN